MSPQAKRERAYRHYVAKQIKEKRKAQARAQKEANRQLKQKLKEAQPGKQQILTSVEDVYSDSAPVSSEAVNEPPPAFKAPIATPTDSVAPPVTVSASDAIMLNQNPDRPSPP